MKITLKQNGGLGPVRKTFEIADTSDLGDMRQEVEALAREVSAQPGSPGAPHPDELGYTLIITGDDGTKKVEGPETSGTPAFSALVERVKKDGVQGWQAYGAE